MTNADHLPRNSRRGRKRDPDIDQRIKNASLEQYAHSGWSGFTFESIAREAGVGKPAVYLRWDSREELLFDALDFRAVPTFTLHSGSLSIDLVEFGVGMHNWWRSRAANAWLRLQLDQQEFPELAAFHRKIVRRNVDNALPIVDDALARGEVSSRASGILLLEIVNGAILTHILMTKPSRRGVLDDHARSYVQDVVDRLALN